MNLPTFIDANYRLESELAGLMLYVLKQDALPVQ